MSLLGYLAKRGIILGNDDEVLITANLFKSQSAPATMTTAATLTAAQLLNGIIVGTPPGAAVSYQLPTGEALDDAMTSFMINNASFDFSVINLSPTDDERITLTVNTNVTIVGSAIVNANDFENSYYRNTGIFRARKTADDTFVIYRIG